jgi:hypothetical protein
MRVVMALAASLILVGCGEVKRHVMMTDVQSLPGGGSHPYSVGPGKVSIEMSASPTGAHVDWIGATGPTCDKEAISYSGEADFERVGQIVISNPRTAKSTSTTVTVTVTQSPKSE